jgi:hypothetical protein
MTSIMGRTGNPDRLERLVVTTSALIAESSLEIVLERMGVRPA